MKSMKCGFALSLFLLMCAFGKTQTVLSAPSESASRRNPNAQALWQQKFESGNFLIGDEWKSIKRNNQGQEEVLTLIFLDSISYKANLTNNVKTVNWSGRWTFTNHVLMLKNEKGESNSPGLKISDMSLSHFVADQTMHFDKSWGAEGVNVIPQGINSTPVKANSSILEVNQVVGTWKVVEKGMFGGNTEFNFTVYSDNRIFAVGAFLSQPCNGSWKIVDELFVPTWDVFSAMGTLQTMSINENTWVFKDMDSNKQSTAQKISKIPVPIPQGIKNPQKPQSPAFDIRQIYGTWKVVPSVGETFYLTLYQDQRFYVCNGMNGNWTVIGDKFYYYVDNTESANITKTTLLSATQWSYEGITSGTKHSAIKTSQMPETGLSLKCTQPTKRFCSSCGKTLDKCECKTPCPWCIGGVQQCNSCSGTGYREANGYRVSCESCSSGSIKCPSCGGTGWRKK